MRVDNGGVNGLGANIYTGPQSGATEVRGTRVPTGSQADRTSLSATGELVALAKTLIPTDYTGRVQTISAAVNAGSYDNDPGAVSQALVDEHIRS